MTGMKRWQLWDENIAREKREKEEGRKYGLL